MNPILDVKQVTLRKDRWISETRVADEFVTNWNRDEIARCHVLRMTKEIPYELVETITHTTPATFLDSVKHFKMLPAWILRRMKPTRYTETIIDVRAYYPRVAMKDEEHIGAYDNTIEIMGRVSRSENDAARAADTPKEATNE